MEPGQINIRVLSTGHAPLHRAVLNDDLSAVETLIIHGADVNLKSRVDGRTALHHASHMNHISLEMVRLLLRHDADVDACVPDGYPALHYVCSYEKMKALIEGGAKVNMKTRIGSNAMHRQAVNFSMSDSDVAESIGELVRHGVDINSQDIYGRTAIMRASFCNRISALQSLCEFGAKLDIADEEGDTLLHYTAFFGTINQIEYLRSAKLSGFDPDIPDMDGDTPLACYRARLDWEPCPGQSKPIVMEAFALCALILEIRNRNWSSGQFLEARARFAADGHQDRLRRWVGYMWQRLHDCPDLGTELWDENKDSAWDEIDLGGEDVDYDTEMLFGGPSSGGDKVEGEEESDEFFDAPDY
ncbi:ankyrin repeat-containing domain protein [Podospora didyma]|uniref:Ankyrin repeat-containing domain protein n=1 Tax=Podospora didyma TaxID=330526 RepID=A0AAE0TVG3_9PEZI|nr:ankyrin repeat-containing domain protein [Podospora didyma]